MNLICIIGNIAAGKSTVIGHLTKLLPDYDVFKIDDFRKDHLAYTAHHERMAQNALKMKLINSAKSCIYESTGISKHYFSNIAAWEKHKGKVLVVLLDAPLEVSQIRYWTRKNLAGLGIDPFPYYSELVPAMQNIDNALEEAYYDYIFDSSQISADQIAASIAALPELEN